LCLALAAEPLPTKARVVSVYDGDTMTLESGEKVRLRWVNTPEKRPPEPYADEARALTERMVLNRTVSLLISGDDARDGYGRLVAGVHNGRENLSLALLEAGLGHVFIIPPENEDMKPFLDAQGRARAGLRGIWSTDRYSGAFHISSFHADGRGDDNTRPGNEYLRVCNITGEAVDTAGFVLKTYAGKKYPLPSVIVPAGHTVLVRSGKGYAQTDPARQLEIFLGTDGPVWDDKYDRATLLGPDGRVVDTSTHEVKGD
jgi:endonuclease YncB( thermonuclease family)